LDTPQSVAKEMVDDLGLVPREELYEAIVDALSERRINDILETGKQRVEKNMTVDFKGVYGSERNIRKYINNHIDTDRTTPPAPSSPLTKSLNEPIYELLESEESDVFSSFEIISRPTTGKREKSIPKKAYSWTSNAAEFNQHQISAKPTDTKGEA